MLDAFCGCATTMVAAQKLGRKWVGIDCDVMAQEVTIKRMVREAGLFDAPQALNVRSEIPERSDGGETAAQRLETEFELAQQKAQILTGPQKEAMRQQLYQEIEGRCEGDRGRGCRFGGSFLRIEFFEMDHIKPKKRGGADRADNLQLICGPCNRAKGAGYNGAGE